MLVYNIYNENSKQLIETFHSTEELSDYIEAITNIESFNEFLDSQYTVKIYNITFKPSDVYYKMDRTNYYKAYDEYTNFVAKSLIEDLKTKNSISYNDMIIKKEEV